MPSRRALLAATVGIAATVTGCAADDRDSPGDTTGTDDPTTTDTDGGASSPSTPTDVDRVDDLYLENLHDEPHTFDVTVQPQRGDDQVVAGRYRIPSERAAVFEGVGQEGVRYEIAATLEDGRSTTTTWNVDDCPNPYEGNRHGGIRVNADGELVFVTNDCDAIVVGHRVTPGSAEYFRVTESAEDHPG